MAVIGFDDRVVVSPSQVATFPFSAVAYVRATFPNGQVSSGSGVMVGPNDLLTAAHVIYNASAGGWADVEIFPGYTYGITPPFGFVQDAGIVSVSGWVNSQDFNYDYALVTTESNIGYQTGWHGLGYLYGDVRGFFVESVGYPGDSFYHPQMQYTSGTIDIISGNAFIFTDDLDSYPGQSGSGVFYTDSSGNTYVIGVVSWEGYFPALHNGVLAFNEAIQNQIIRWTQENDISIPTPPPSPTPTPTPIPPNSSNSETIQEVYVALFGRPADPLGLSFWMSNTNNGLDLSPMLLSLGSSQEYVGRFSGLSAALQVNSIFQSLFGRDADLQGLTFFSNQLNSGSQTLSTIAVNILDGAQASDARTIQNKIAAANVFTSALDTSQEILAYSGTQAANIARAFISNVTSDARTIPTSAQAQATIELMLRDLSLDDSAPLSQPIDGTTVVGLTSDNYFGYEG